MYNVTVIFTRHDEKGSCNSLELLKIIESILPEVVFEELPYSVYNNIYSKQSRSTLESDAIKMHLQNHNLEHIPVDTFEPPEYYHSTLNYMMDRIENRISDSYSFKVAVSQLMSMTIHGGFKFLNSDENDLFHEKVREQEDRILTLIANDKLNQIAELRREVDSKREDEIIENIHKYSKQMNTIQLFCL